MEPMKEKIAYHARRLFDIHGFHGTALRDVCKLAGCKMPTIYYYYESKEKLFDEVVRVAFEDLVARLWTQLPKDVSYKEYNIQKVIQKKHLTEDELIIYRLAIKTWLRCEGFEECRKKLVEWEQKAYQKAWEEYASIVGSVQWAKFIARSITDLIQRIVLLEEDIPDSEIIEEINMIFDVATHSNIKK
ncbi:MAG: Biofilm operon icaADBC HTH-type negative transcriptional regulator IcaR [Firmicutes bacterium ADurb.Bin419]|nr:MAG: Biofilm operon icaADBC HTH-type negative transcriptional regulator IcaR [Firmicutes bacterium ADurb.Bin419]